MAKGIVIDMGRLAELADEVSKTKRPRAIRINRDVVAVLRPAARRSVRRAKREPTVEDIAAFEAAAGRMWIPTSSSRTATRTAASPPVLPLSYDLPD